jgi:two-component system sensor histidine kinase KdpD
MGFVGKAPLQIPFSIYMSKSNPHLISSFWLSDKNRQFIRYLWSFVLIGAATGISSLVTLEFSPTNLVIIYLLAVVIAAVFLGRGPAILASILGVLAFDFFFVPPKYTLTVSDTEYLLTFAGFLLVGWVISYLTALTREHAEDAQRREAETAALYALSRDLASADDLKAISTAVITHMVKTVKSDVVVFMPDKGGLQIVDQTQNTHLDREDLEAADWSYQQGVPAGVGTVLFPNSLFYFTPLKTSQSILGVLGVHPNRPLRAFTSQQLRLLEAFASQAALAIERVRLAEQARNIELLQATEKLQNALLNSISHDLRTPLVSITGALSTLDEENASLGDDARESLIETAREEADRLNRLVGNLLEMTRLEAGALHVVPEQTDLQDMIGAALGQIEHRLTSREITIDVPDDLPLVPMDFVLIVHALVNLLDNALKYSSEGSPLGVQAQLKDGEVQIAVLDRGLGIPPEDLTRVFDKFYRVQRPEQVAGTGLGLAICKGIVEAHGGRIWASNRAGGGTIVTIALPCEIKTYP